MIIRKSIYYCPTVGRWERGDMMIQNGTDELYYSPQLLDAVRILATYNDNAVIQTLSGEETLAATDVTTSLGKIRYLAAVKTDSLGEARQLISSDLDSIDELFTRVQSEKKKAVPLPQQKRRR